MEVLNLVRDRWLPLRRRSGSVEIVEPFRVTDRCVEDPFVALAWPRPDFNGAAHEFLIGLLATAAAPESQDAWEDWWSSPPSPEVLEARFATIAHAFEVDGPGPRFLQDLDPLENATVMPISSLLIDAPGAQTLRKNADIFVRRDGADSLGRAAAAMALYTLNAYAPAGGAGHRTSLRGGGPLTTLVIAGDTLWGRLWPNVETHASIRERWPLDAPLPDDPAAIFPWLGPTRTSNPKAGGRQTGPADVHPLQVHWGMPRRIRLVCAETGVPGCPLTGIDDGTTVKVTAYRTRNYGTNYATGFEHPLTPYYAQKTGGIRLPVHPRPGGLGYRHWAGLVVATGDGLRQPARTVTQGPAARRLAGELRLAAFGFDMDNAKARGWTEYEESLPCGAETHVRTGLQAVVQQATEAANTVSRLLVSAVKSALHDRPGDTAGDYGFLAERFFRQTQQDFHDALDAAAEALRAGGATADDATLNVRLDWARRMTGPALRLFDEHAPVAPSGGRGMARHVRARFHLSLALGGRGKIGRELFGALGIPAPAGAGDGSKQEAGGRMPDTESKSPGATAAAWWRALTRPSVAHLRRAATPLEALQESATMRLIQLLPDSHSADRVAALAGILAWVGTTDSRPVARTIGRGSVDAADALLTEGRFRSLLQVEGADEMMTSMRRLVRLAGGRVNVADLAESVLHWHEIPVRERWMFEYYGVGMAVPSIAQQGDPAA